MFCLVKVWTVTLEYILWNSCTWMCAYCEWWSKQEEVRSYKIVWLPFTLLFLSKTKVYSLSGWVGRWTSLLVGMGQSAAFWRRCGMRLEMTGCACWVPCLMAGSTVCWCRDTFSSTPHSLKPSVLPSVRRCVQGQFWCNLCFVMF